MGREKMCGGQSKRLKERAKRTEAQHERGEGWMVGGDGGRRRAGCARRLRADVYTGKRAILQSFKIFLPCFSLQCICFGACTYSIYLLYWPFMRDHSCMLMLVHLSLAAAFES